MSWQLLTPPEAEPVSLLEAKQHLKVDHDEDDELIQSLITAAREAAESLTGRQLITAHWRYILDRFPGHGAGEASPMWIIKCPVQHIVSIDYLSIDGQWRKLPPTDYSLHPTREPARLAPAFGTSWPLTLPQQASVMVTLVAGYGSPEMVPEGIKSWMKLRLGALYAHREEIAYLVKGRLDPLPFVDRLLDPFRIVML